MFPVNLNVHDYKINSKKSIINQIKQISLVVNSKHRLSQNQIHCFRRGTPLSAPIYRNEFKRGSFTVEAAVVIPIFLYFFVSILYIFQIFHVQMNIKNALHETARQLAIYSHVLDDDNSSRGFSVVKYGLEQIGTTVSVNQAIEDPDIFRYIEGGKCGISYVQKKDQKNYISIVAKYTVVLPISYFGKQRFSMQEKVVYRKWNGYDFSDVQISEEMVYVTETGTVYHTNRNCSYLQPSIHMAFASQLENLRNSSGGKYYACGQCAKNGISIPIYYITDYGECYHSSLSCSGLKRTIYCIPISEVGSKKCCTKCRGGTT